MTYRSRNTSPDVWERAQKGGATKHDCDYLAANKEDAQPSAILRSTWNIYLGLGLPPMHHLAESWMEWGHPVSIMDATQGDTIVLKYHKTHFVGLFETWQFQNVRVFSSEPGGVFPRTAIRAIRRLRL